MSEPAAAFYLTQLARAVLHVHAAGFCHRDIKVWSGFCWGLLVGLVLVVVVVVIWGLFGEGEDAL
jgi:serine/threonine protein kinase